MEQQLTLEEFDKYWNFRKPADTARIFRSLLPLADIYPDPAILPQLLTQIARCEGLLRNFAQAFAILEQAALLIHELDPALRPLPMVRLLLETGRLRNSNGESSRGADEFEEAWEISTEQGLDFYAVDAAHMLGIVMPREEALQWNVKAMLFAEQSQDIRAKGWLGALYNNLGWTYHEKSEFILALDCFRKSELWYAERNRAEEALIARWSAARMLRLLGRPDEALQELEYIANARAQAGLSDDGYFSEEKGECLLLMGDIDQATPCFAAAFAILSADPWMVQNESKRLERMKQLGKVAGP
jgi:tetratricopeptide (TPR) repeat protein